MLRLLRSLVRGLTEGALSGSAEKWCTNRLFAASFGCLNIAIVEIIFHQFPNSKRALLIPYGIFLIFLLIFLAIQVLPLLVRQSMQSLRTFRVSSEVPLCLAAGALVLSGVYAPLSAVLVGSGLHYAESAVLIMLLLAFADCINLKSLMVLKKQSVFSIPDMVPEVRRVNTEDPQNSSLVPAGEIKARDRIVLEKGSIIPADSLVVGGSADLLERRNTFDGQRRFKKPGDTVYAASEVIDGVITVQALASPSKSDISAYFEQMNASITCQNPYRSLLLRTETGINIICISAAVGATLYWLGAEAGFFASSSVFIATLLVSIFSRTAPVLWEMVRAVLSTSARFGAYCSNIINTYAGLAAIRSLVIDFLPDDPIGQYSISSVSMLDERVSEKAVYSVLLSLFSRSDKGIHKDLCVSMEKHCRECKVEEVTEWGEIEDMGVVGMVQGVRFMAGTEGALLSQGVRFEVSPDPEDEATFFLACGSMPIARFVIQEPFYSDGPAIMKGLERIGVHILLAGNAAADRLDAIGKKVGLELHAIAGGLNTASFKERLEGSKPAALIANCATSQEVRAGAQVTLSYFDERAWDFNAADLVIFGRSLLPILFSIQAAKAWQATRKILTFAITAVGVVAMMFAMARITSPLAIASVLAICALMEYALLVRLFQRISTHRTS